ncbi:MAG: KEOPS complex subunit Pcc1 [Archaeoglobaceae archaeon]|nr:KEOPS complex subunit Pcc1 [Archaeoglobaceae archaeon]MDW8118186.1 KEOPS complex subunit Pcc1 [Archaeoglobaceae archaeon]
MKAFIEIESEEDVLRALKPEESNAISKAKIYQSEGKLRIEIFADTISDLRAAVNSWLRLVNMCFEIEVLI